MYFTDIVAKVFVYLRDKLAINQPNMKMKQWTSLFILALLNFFLGFACYNASRPTYSYLFGSIQSRWYNAKLAKITEEGYNMCPPDTKEFCKTPCWKGIPYQEPKFLLTPNCIEYSSRQALVYVYSSLDNHQLRQSVRQKFAESFSRDDNMTISLIFVVGLPTKKTLANHTVIENEHKTYGDIMQISILDIYNHLAFKGLAVFKWVQQCGEKTKYLAKLDDNSLTYININSIFLGLKSMQENDKVVQNSICCLLPLYDYYAYEKKPRKHWESDFDQYFSTKCPTFCQGKWGTFMTRQVALSLYKASRGVPIFHTDDAFITGMLRERACVEVLNCGTFDKFLLAVLTKKMHSLIDLLAYEVVLKDMDRKERRNNTRDKFYNWLLYNWSLFDRKG